VIYLSKENSDSQSKRRRVHIDEFGSSPPDSALPLEISVVIPAYDEEENISALISGVRMILEKNQCVFEIIVVDAKSKDDTVKRAKEAGANVFIQSRPGYGMALKEGFDKANGKYVITMDADLSHDPLFIEEMLKISEDADMIIASRYIPGGSAEMGSFRRYLSIILNRMFCLILSLPYRDISSGYRFYNQKVLEQVTITSRDFDVLEEILIRAHQQGFRIVEVPFHYKPRAHGKSHVKLLHFGLSFSRTLWKMWRLRRSSH
jgi:dolichol-phosphate mannosyltransferase